MADTASGTHFDFVIIGGGPAGYVGAIRAAQLGYKVACVERAKLGGVCLNWGCIPSKSLLANAELVEKLKKKEDQSFWGLKIGGEIGLDWDRIIGRSREVASKLNGGIGFLFKKNKITHLVGNAKIAKAESAGAKAKVTIEVQECEVKEELTSARQARQDDTDDHLRPLHRGDGIGAICPLPSLMATASGARGDVQQAAAEETDRRRRARSAWSSLTYHSMGTEVTVVEMLDWAAGRRPGRPGRAREDLHQARHEVHAEHDDDGGGEDRQWCEGDRRAVCQRESRRQ